MHPFITKKAIFALVAGIAIVLAALGVIFLANPVSPQFSLPFQESPSKAPESPEAPVCTLVIESDRIAGNQIELRYVTGDCPVTELAVYINNKMHGTLNQQAGSSATFQGNSGSNTVVVVASFPNGSTAEVYHKLL